MRFRSWTEFSLLKEQSKILSSRSRQYSLKLANAIYIQDEFHLTEQYLQSSQEFFDNAIKKVNFQDSVSAANIINKWIANQTKGKIQNLVTSQSLNALTKLVLVNAIYFKGTWKYKFNSAHTRLLKFVKQDGCVSDVPMMYQQVMSRFGYFTAGKISYQVVELPYIGDEASIFLALPAEGTDLTELEKLITPQLIHNWFSTMTEEDIEINLPRFTIQQRLDLKEPFGVLNVTEIFGSECDLSGITESSDLYISEAVHQAFIEINEDGSEAAASSGLLLLAIMSLPRHKFMANHPFVFLIRSNLTGSILFIGRVMDPEGVNSYGRDKDALSEEDLSELLTFDLSGPSTARNSVSAGINERTIEVQPLHPISKGGALIDSSLREQVGAESREKRFPGKREQLQSSWTWAESPQEERG
ncbi:serpin I2-like [Stegostoma tigrinum]|uniref:serpin I2-like n=1 Tax=Stegostoma tigrinum TaxID=3053191 RepID=UPI00286FD052|nr:serpin I2-like [Stegostoma tigrinum]